MVYGLFVLAGGLAALFFLFNAGQLTQDKDKLIITADATAYSAGVMHARALNYTAYANRALIANEIAVAQMVSVASWTRYTQEHALGSLSLGCTTIYNDPAARGFLQYAPLCMSLAWGLEVIEPASQWVERPAAIILGRIEEAKRLLQHSQRATMGLMAMARAQVMRDVANANFRGNGQVNVDLLEDHYFFFDGGALLQERGNAQRQRMADVAVARHGHHPVHRHQRIAPTSRRARWRHQPDWLERMESHRHGLLLDLPCEQAWSMCSAQ